MEEQLEEQVEISYEEYLVIMRKQQMAYLHLINKYTEQYQLLQANINDAMFYEQIGYEVHYETDGNNVSYTAHKKKKIGYGVD